MFVRTDTAGYDYDLLRMMAEGRHPRFGVIHFAVGADMTPELKAEISRIPASEWKPYPQPEGSKAPKQEWAEVPFVTTRIAYKKGNPEYRYLAVREVLRKQPQPETDEQLHLDLPAPDAEFDTSAYKLRAIVTNLLDWDGDRVIRWHRERCGRSEQAHDVLKNELAGGTVPSKHFGVNAAWWLITVLAHNLNQAMKILALTKIDASWSERRLKAVRFHLIRLPGRVTQHAREMIVRVSRRAVRFLRGDPKTDREAHPCGPGLTAGSPRSVSTVAASMDASRPSACPKTLAGAIPGYREDPPPALRQRHSQAVKSSAGFPECLFRPGGVSMPRFRTQAADSGPCSGVAHVLGWIYYASVGRARKGLFRSWTDRPCAGI